MVLSNIVDQETLRKVQLETLEVIKNALIKSFGPFGSNTIIYHKGDLPRYTKDGHTILSNINFSGDIECSVKTDIEEETRTQAVNIGDSTTSISILSYLIFKGLIKYLDGSTASPASIVRDFGSVVQVLKAIIEKNGRECTLDDIYNIALISTNNNDKLATQLAEIYKMYGMEVYIDVKASMNNTSYYKEINGMSLECGFMDPTFVNNTEKNECTIRHPKIYAFTDPIDTMEMGLFFDIILQKNIIEPIQNQDPDAIVPTVILAPKISRDYSGYIDQLMSSLAQAPAANRGFLNIVTNITGADMDQFTDICDLCGCKYIKKYIDPEIQKQEIEAGLAPTLENIDEFAGTAEVVTSDAYKTMFLYPSKMYDENGNNSELFNQRIDYLEKQIEKLKVEGNNTTDTYKLKKRLNSLKGKMVEIYIGGVTVADRDAERDLMEDAVLNCRSASLAGVGYGANYEGLRAAAIASRCIVETDKDKVLNDICTIIYDAYKEISAELYLSLDNIDIDKANAMVEESINEMKGPYNLSTNKYDGKVLSSIDTDICTLETISKIITIMATSNQFLLPTINSNNY